MTREDKIKTIYKEIADKTLSFGCKIKSHRCNTTYTIAVVDEEVIVYAPRKNDNIYHFDYKERLENGVLETIGHPVMIGDVLDYLENNLGLYYDTHNIAGCKDNDIWKYKRKPIEEQSDECIDFIYDLIQENKKNFTMKT